MPEPPTEHRSPTFIGDLNFAQHFDGDRSSGWVELTEELRAPGSDQVRVSVLATLADIFTGILATNVTSPMVALTVDLTLRRLAETSADRLEATARVLRTGRTITVAEADFTEPGTGRLVAISHATFLASPRPQDVQARMGDFRPSERRFPRPFAEELGARVLAPGVVEMDREPYVQQPTGTIQGGALALLSEVAVESLLGGRVDELELRYLRGIRSGPGRATTTALSAETAKVEVRDPGHEDRLTTLVIGRIARGRS